MTGDSACHHETREMSEIPGSAGFRSPELLWLSALYVRAVALGLAVPTVAPDRVKMFRRWQPAEVLPSCVQKPSISLGSVLESA